MKKSTKPAGKSLIDEFLDLAGCTGPASAEEVAAANDAVISMLKFVDDHVKTGALDDRPEWLRPQLDIRSLIACCDHFGWVDPSGTPAEDTDVVAPQAAAADQVAAATAGEVAAAPTTPTAEGQPDE
jgi:hypothetical protein